MSHVLQLRDARKAYDRVLALDGLSLTLDAGECLGLLGPNGAGKTTAIRALCGRVRLDAGSILWNGAAAPAVSRLIGLVPQELALYPRLTGRENLRVFGGLHGLRGSHLASRVAWALEWSGLAERADDPVRHWSIGMQRRLNIACGILHEPRVILLDEPTAGVDPVSRQRIWELLLGLRASGVALLLTTHLLNEAQSVADRIAIVKGGRLVASGTSAEIVCQAMGRDHHATVVLGNGAREDAVMEDVLAELPPLLERIRQRGDTVLALEVGQPDLEAAFLRLIAEEGA